MNQSVSAPPNASRKSSSGLIEFFRHHGAWAPGVKLFRRMQFRAKALIILTSLLVPLAMLLVFQWQLAREKIEVASSERDGVRYIRALSDLGRAATMRRHAATLRAPDLADWQKQVSESFAKVDAVQNELGSAFGLKESFDEMRRRHEQLKASPAAGKPDDTLEARWWAGQPQFRPISVALALELLAAKPDTVRRQALMERIDTWEAGREAVDRKSVV